MAGADPSFYEETPTLGGRGNGWDGGGVVIADVLVRAKISTKRDCIPVGCIPPARSPYLPACYAGKGGVCSGMVSALGGVCSGELVSSQGYLLLGVCCWVECLLQGGCLLPGVCLFQGDSAPEGLLPGGVSTLGGCLFQGAVSACENMPVKT